ncbi:MAG: protealysin inhibitor emfourin [Pelagimonas sp.]|uniref:protealysin inhibitor emfourin n=1 Tax=Pelagimonas sp. TaxID=2073170 RepID=UPI003D6BD92C
MMIEISSSGGFAGIAATRQDKVLDLSSVSEPKREAYCAAFDPRELASLVNEDKHSGAADLMTYRITVTDEKNAQHQFELREDQLPPDVLDLIDEM